MGSQMNQEQLGEAQRAADFRGRWAPEMARVSGGCKAVGLGI